MKCIIKVDFICVFFLMWATARFRVMYTAHFLFLLDSTVIEHIRSLFLKSGMIKNSFPYKGVQGVLGLNHHLTNLLLKKKI